MEPGRRRFVRRCAASGAALVVAGSAGGALWLAGAAPPVEGFADTAAALRWLAALQTSPRAHATGTWSLPQVLEHAAQSVDYSLDGYPRLHSSLFRCSIGRVAFLAFARRGRMAHATDEPIPGAPALSVTSLDAACVRLAAALQRFESQPASAYAPHFAYGALTRDEYRRAHLMHLADHAREVVSG